MGRKVTAPYKIVASMSVSRSIIMKAQYKNNAVKIRIKQGEIDKITIEGFTLAYDSGNEYRSGN